MNLDRIKTAKLEAEVAKLKSEKKALEQDVRRAVVQLEQLRAAKSVPLKFRSVKASAHRDKVRVIVPDTHGRAICEKAAGAFLSDLKQIQPHEIVMTGDLIDCGGFLAQHHVMGYVAETSYSYEEDAECANQFLDRVQEASSGAETDVIEGNHDRRPETWAVTQALRNSRDAEMLRRMVAPEFILRLKQRKIRYHRQAECSDGLNVPGVLKRGKVFFWHGTSSAANTAIVNLRQIGGNVVFGHVHREQSIRARDVANGDHGAWCPGCLCKLQPLWQHTRPSGWTHGYGLQLIAPSGNFLHINIGIVDGVSLMVPLLHRETSPLAKK